MDRETIPMYRTLEQVEDAIRAFDTAGGALEHFKKAAVMADVSVAFRAKYGGAGYTPMDSMLKAKSLLSAGAA